MSAKVTITDDRLVVSGHAGNKPSCLAITTASYTFACILGAQGYLARTVEITRGDETLDPPLSPVFDMLLLGHESARQGAAGFLEMVTEIERKYPGEIEVTDNRHLPVGVHRPPKPLPPEPEENFTPSFADMLPRPGGLRDTNGRQLRVES